MSGASLMRRSRRRRGGYRKSLPYLLPALLIYTVFFIVPVVQLVQMSTTQWDGIGDPVQVGGANYTDLLSDGAFFNAFGHSVLWVFGALVFPTSIGLAAAILLTRTNLFGRTFFRTVYFLPQVLASVVVAIVARVVYHPITGSVNTLLSALGLENLTQGWLGNPATALPAVFVAWTWVQFGFAMVILLAGLQNISEDYFDVARLEGASLWKQTRYVIIPMLRRPLTTVVLVMMIAAFQVFDIVFLTTRGGPGGATEVISTYMIEQSFNFHNFGYGSAIAVVLGVLVLLVSVALLRIRRLDSETL